MLTHYQHFLPEPHVQYSADWILISTLRDEENAVTYFGYEYRSLACMTFPNEMKSLMKDFVGLQDIQSHNIGTFGLGSGVSWDPALTLNHMESRFNEGRMEAMFINASMANDQTGKIKGSTIGDHWVTYNGGLKVNYDTNNAVQSYTFNVITWGQNKQVTVTPEEFRETYHGSVSGK